MNKEQNEKTPEELFLLGCDEYEQENKAKAFKLWKQAADKGYVHAQFIVGSCYEQGEGVEKDLSKAIEYYQQAAHQRDRYAQYNLGICYKNGNGVETDLKKAFEYYKKSAEKGHVEAQVNVATCYKNGDGTKKHFANAFKYFKLAATNGNLNASIAVKTTQLLSPEKEKYNQNISKIADEIIGLFKKIREILTPEVFNKNLYHFTSLSALESMLNVKEIEKEEAFNFLRLYDSIGMNDPSEGRALLSDNFKLSTKSSYYSQQKHLNYFYKDGEDTFVFPENEDLHCFTASFTEKGDSLNLWRAYGNDGDGFCIEFNPSMLKIADYHSITKGNFNLKKNSEENDEIIEESKDDEKKINNTQCLFHKIKYGEEDKKNVFKEILPLLKKINDAIENAEIKNKEERVDNLKGLIRSILNPLMFTFKTESYESENEWRLICQIPNISKEYTDRVTFDEQKPPRLFIESEPVLFKTDKKDKLEIIIGPKVKRKDIVKHYLEFLLRKRGFDNVEVKYSKIKYRD